MKIYSTIYNSLCLILIIVLGNSCNRLEQKKFVAPVEQIIRIDSTKIGVTTILSDLNVPWEIAWGPDNQIWFTEQSGTISKVDPHTGKKKLLLDITHEVYRQRTLGLLGMVIYPDKKQHYLIVDYTTHTGKDSILVSRLVRYTYTNDTLKNPFILLEIPGGPGGHNGSRVAVSPDGKVFWSTGDATRDKNAQDILSLNGKILRLNIDGSIPIDNPYPGSPVWSFGHRNSQGLVFTPEGILFNSEHGDATDDEVNLIQKSRNYGWPNVEGYCNTPDEKAYCDSTGIAEPIKAWTPCIAPSGIDYYHSAKIPEWNNSILLVTLKGSSFRVLKLNKQGNSIISEKIYFQNQFGRLRDICVSPTGDIYISTSNRDWNPLGVPKKNDDRIIRIGKISEVDNLSQVNINDVADAASGRVSLPESSSPGNTIYTNYCASCHKKDGSGVAGTFPALRNNQYVTGEKRLLTKIVLKGSVALPIKNQYEKSEKMPAFNFLNDQQIADVLTYIRQTWGNHADSISNEEVKKTRK
ncbi:MAG: PQQ-dependent sugar dehydrogenase [Ginsengibacter sp.]